MIYRVPSFLASYDKAPYPAPLTSVSWTGDIQED